MTKVEDVFDPNEVFGGDNEDLIDELSDEESKEDHEPFRKKASNFSSKDDDFIFERA